MINICVNGLFRYDQYIRHFKEKNILSQFYYSHKISTNADKLGIREDQANNLWLKEYILHGILKVNPSLSTRLKSHIYDLWQHQVLSRYQESDCVLAVIGEAADKILSVAKRQGSTTIGHAVTSHPSELEVQLSIEHEILGLPKPNFTVSPRRIKEIDLCDKIIVDSSFVARSYSAHGIPLEKIKIFTPGADLSRFSARDPEAVGRKEFSVVSVGALNPRKGHRYLLEAWKMLGAPGKLTIIGSETEFTKDLVGSYSDIFEHVPYVANAELRKILITASVFVLPSVEDGFAQAAMEALACGVPVICTSNAGIADLVSQGVNGYVVEPRDSKAIAECLSKLLDDRILTAELGVNAAAMVKSTGSWENYVEKFITEFCVNSDRKLGVSNADGVYTKGR